MNNEINPSIPRKNSKTISCKRKNSKEIYWEIKKLKSEFIFKFIFLYKKISNNQIITILSKIKIEFDGCDEIFF